MLPSSVAFPPVDACTNWRGTPPPPASSPRRRETAARWRMLRPVRHKSKLSDSARTNRVYCVLVVLQLVDEVIYLFMSHDHH